MSLTGVLAVISAVATRAEASGAVGCWDTGAAVGARALVAGRVHCKLTVLARVSRRAVTTLIGAIEGTGATIQASGVATVFR